VDDLIGQFVGLLKELGLYQDCLISVTGFHGLPLGERSGVPSRFLGLHEELVHLPLVLKLPGSQSAGRRVHHLTQIENWFMMLAEVFEIENCYPGPAHYSLYGLAQGQGRRLNEYLVTEATAFLHSGPREVAVRTPDWYLILPISEWRGRPVQLYRKPEDRWEMNNVIREHADVADHLELTWHRHRHKGEAAKNRRKNELLPLE
jgi:arylsulfatase A-like enzyme